MTEELTAAEERFIQFYVHVRNTVLTALNMQGILSTELTDLTGIPEDRIHEMLTTVTDISFTEISRLEEALDITIIDLPF